MIASVTPKVRHYLVGDGELDHNDTHKIGPIATQWLALANKERTSVLLPLQKKRKPSRISSMVAGGGLEPPTSGL